MQHRRRRSTNSVHTPWPKRTVTCRIMFPSTFQIGHLHLKELLPTRLRSTVIEKQHHHRDIVPFRFYLLLAHRFDFLCADAGPSLLPLRLPCSMGAKTCPSPSRQLTSHMRFTVATGLKRGESPPLLLAVQASILCLRGSELADMKIQPSPTAF